MRRPPDRRYPLWRHALSRSRARWARRRSLAMSGRGDWLMRMRGIGCIERHAFSLGLIT
jgi:hypothetical protein